MATNFSPCKGSYVLNQFPSNVMFGMNGFHVSASGAIQGHHGPLVTILLIIDFQTGKNLMFNPRFLGIYASQNTEIFLLAFSGKVLSDLSIKILH